MKGNSNNVHVSPPYQGHSPQEAKLTKALVLLTQMSRLLQDCSVSFAPGSMLYWLCILDCF